jgi:hypothetical protein
MFATERADQADDWFMVGEAKLVVMSIATLNLYQVYWFYEHWKRVKASTGDGINPAARALFPFFFCYALFNRIAVAAAASAATTTTVAAANGGQAVFVPGVLAAGYVLLCLSGSLPTVGLVVGFGTVLPLLVVQRAANGIMLRQNPQVSPNRRLTVLNWGWLAIVGCFAALAVVGALLPEPAPATSRAVLSEAAATINKGLPRTVDDETQLVETIGLEGVLVYRYRLVNYTIDQLDPQLLATNLREGAKKSSCSNQRLRDVLLDKGVTLRHVYADRNDTDIVTIDLKSADCGS